MLVFADETGNLDGRDCLRRFGYALKICIKNQQFGTFWAMQLSEPHVLV